MTRGRPEYQVIDHTADAGIVVRAPDVRTLFERAAAAMFDLIVDVDAVAGELTTGAVLDVIEVTAPDREALLVAWLGELLSRAMTTSIVFGAFEVDEVESTRLRGKAWGLPLEVRAHGFRTELKAVTYHELLVSEDRDGWSARVIFDV